jgi:hypothetical protein
MGLELAAELAVAAWRHSVALIGQDIGTVSVGGLLALYPSWEDYGEQLGQLSQREAETLIRHPRIEPLKRGEGAINLVTAQHLGVDIEKHLHRFNIRFATGPGVIWAPARRPQTPPLR